MLQKLIKAGTQGVTLVVLLTALTGVAFAQMPMPSLHIGADNKPPPTPEEIEKQKALDDAYKSATKKVPDKRVDDPWATVRPAPTSPTASKDKQASKTKQQ